MKIKAMWWHPKGNPWLKRREYDPKLIEIEISLFKVAAIFRLPV
jgi:hypothetical protein